MNRYRRDDLLFNLAATAFTAAIIGAFLWWHSWAINEARSRCHDGAVIEDRWGGFVCIPGARR